MPILYSSTLNSFWGLSSNGANMRCSTYLVGCYKNPWPCGIEYSKPSAMQPAKAKVESDAKSTVLKHLLWLLAGHRRAVGIVPPCTFLHSGTQSSCASSLPGWSRGAQQAVALGEPQGRPRPAAQAAPLACMASGAGSTNGGVSHFWSSGRTCVTKHCRLRSASS